MTHRRSTLVAMCAGYFLVLLDVTIVNVALPRIAAGLHAGVGALQWVVDGYALALASLMLGGGTIGDRHGHRRVVLAGFALLGLGSLGCGLAPSAACLAGLRVAQGMGAALMLPGTLAVITRAYPRDADRARAIGVWAAVGGIALPAGPILGGAVVVAVGWRGVFLINLPIVAGAMIVTARVVRETAEPDGPRVDLPGIGLAAGLLATLTFALIEAGRGGGPAVGVAGGAALVLLVAFVLVQRRAPEPMLPLALLRRPEFTTANAVAGTMNLATLGLLFVLTLYLQDVRRDGALAAGLSLLPLFGPLAVIAPAVGGITARHGARRPMLAGLLVGAGGFAALSVVPADAAYPVLAGALVLWGCGIAVLTPAVVAAAVGAVPGRRAGLASAVNNTARQAGGAIGIAAFGALAGSPGSAGFMAGLHTAALIAAGLFLAAAAATSAFVRP